MAKLNGSLNGWAKTLLIVLLAGGGGMTAGGRLLGNPPNPIVTSEQWTKLNVEVGRLAEAVENLEKTVARLIPKP